MTPFITPLRSLAIVAVMVLIMQAMPPVKAFLMPSATTRASALLVARDENGGDPLVERVVVLETKEISTTATLERIERNMAEGFKDINNKMDEGFKDVNNKMDEGFKDVNNKMDEGFKDVNNKLTALTVAVAILGTVGGMTFIGPVIGKIL